MWDVPEPEVAEEDDEAEGDEEQNGAGPVSAVPKVRATPCNNCQESAVRGSHLVR